MTSDTINGTMGTLSEKILAVEALVDAQKAEIQQLKSLVATYADLNQRLTNALHQGGLVTSGGYELDSADVTAIDKMVSDSKVPIPEL